MASNPKKFFTPEEYLALEREADYKSEYLDGEIFAMAGASLTHIAIEANVIRELGNKLLEKPSQVYTSNMKIDLSKHGMYAYPDALVVCGDPVFHDKHKDNLTNPLVIVEVLSDPTEGYDRGEKFLRYRKLKSFKEYLLISQHVAHVEHYSKQENNKWMMSEYDGLQASLELPSLEMILNLSSIYAKVKFEESESA
jgi:Uma2 family endonuclease